MNAEAVLKKMHVKPGMKLLVLHAPVTQIAIDETWSALCFRPKTWEGK